jgi:hypothetical protein
MGQKIPIPKLRKKQHLPHIGKCMVHCLCFNKRSYTIFPQGNKYWF